MKYQTKPNQFSIGKVEQYKVRIIKAIKVNSKEKTLSYVKIENCIGYIKLNCDFHNYKTIVLSDTNDFLFIGTDKDLKNRNIFRINDSQESYFGNAIIARIPKSCDYDKLQSTKMTLEEIKEIVVFD